MTQPVRVGLIGVGGHARQVLIPALLQLPEELELVVLATGHAATAQTMGARYRLPAVVGHEAVLQNPDVVAVIIATNANHERIAAEALAAGKHVFTETPGIATRAGAAQIRQLARERGLVYQVGSCLRYAPIYLKLRRWLEASRAAAPGPRTINVRYYPYIGHFQNLLLYLAGPITHVLNVPHPDRSGAVSLYRFANGDLGSITWSAFRNVALAYEAVEVLHPSGRLLAEDGRSLRWDRTEQSRHPYAMEFDLPDAQLHQPTFSLPYGPLEQLHLRGYTPELAGFARCVREGVTPLCGVDDAEQTLLVAQATGRSTGEWTAVEAWDLRKTA